MEVRREGGRRKCGFIRPLWFEEQDPALSFHRVTRKKSTHFSKGRKKEQAKKRTPFRKNLGPDAQTPEFKL